jgi:ADP-ribose pyrophosphatase YjhB (NUDIX family)
MIRAMVVGVVWRGRELLVVEGYNVSNAEAFYRPLGGGIEFGEPAEEALAREFREEIESDLEDLRYLGTLENIYVYEGYPGHELVRVYEARLVTQPLYERDSWDFQTEDGSTCHAAWKPLEDFASARLYPNGLLELIKAATPDLG